MGTQIQTYKLIEEDYRGTQFSHVEKLVKNNNDLLNITKPEIITEIHEAYLLAGADIIETNTFNGTSISQSDYGLESWVFEMNKQASLLARKASDKLSTPVWRRFVAGAVGPTNRTASVSPKVEDPAFRNVTYTELVTSYKEQIAGLVEGGCHIIFIETIFDTLNARAAIFAY
jgi:5-methyltetrahydrofolate--homocysteine methyltransferase